MTENKDVENWLDYWKSLKDFVNDRSDLEQAESWNKRWSRPTNGILKGNSPEKKQKRVEEIFKMLGEAGFQVNGARILDIGSGTGAFAIPFAKAGAKVTSLDISSTALERLRADAEKEGLSIETIELSWWTADIDKLDFRNKFDLVFVTSTPAVKDPDCFNRMMSCSNNFCYYGFHIRNGRPSHGGYQEVLRKILKKEPPGLTAGKGSLFMNGFVYLYLMGYRPLIRINHNQRSMAMDWEEAADDTIKSLESTETCTEATKKEIREYYKTSAVDGKYHTKYDGYSGMMVWKVNR